MKTLFDLKGKTAFVPGGYGGIGAAISKGLARAGARVTVAGRDGAKAAALARSLGAGARGVALDVEDVGAIREVVDGIGRVDLLVNCVGIQQEQAILDVDEETYDRIYRTNLKSAMFLAQAVARRQIAAKRGGRQVHLLSVRAQLGLRGRGYSAYCSTKGGLVMLIRQHASELGKHGICVNGVAPTVVRTEMGAHWLKDPKTRAWLQERIPLGRVAEPEDCVGATLFFCAPAGAYVTGQILYLDGGITASQ
jgi:NAD(P)-dependent dehydrogenase (short-subunit alcohol dehydrogenase family)